MKTNVIFILAVATISFAAPLKLDNATFDVNLDSVSRQRWVQDLGVRGCNYANDVRRRYGRSTLYYSASLTNLGARHSNWMAHYNIFQHQSLYGLGAWIGRNWLPATAENIAMSVPRSTDAAWDAHVQWYHSPGHFRNMINPSHTHCGVGIAYDRVGRWWGTQLFGQNHFIGHEHGSGAAAPAAPRPATAPASAPAPAPARDAPAPAPAAGSTPRPRPSPTSGTASGDRPAEEFQTSLLGEPLSISDISTPPTKMPGRG